MRLFDYGLGYDRCMGAIAKLLGIPYNSLNISCHMCCTVIHKTVVVLCDSPQEVILVMVSGQPSNGNVQIIDCVHK